MEFAGTCPGAIGDEGLFSTTLCVENSVASLRRIGRGSRFPFSTKWRPSERRHSSNHMVTLLDIRESSVAVQILVLQRAAYSVEAQQIGCIDFPPLHETLDALQHSTDCFLGFVEHRCIVGCLSYEWAGACATITRLVVNPQHFRRGIASVLLRSLDHRLPVGIFVWASTGDLNEPAVRAYEKQGYKTAARRFSPEGIALRLLNKQVAEDRDQRKSQPNAAQPEDRRRSG